MTLRDHITSELARPGEVYVVIAKRSSPAG